MSLIECPCPSKLVTSWPVPKSNTCKRAFLPANKSNGDPVRTSIDQRQT